MFVSLSDNTCANDVIDNDVTENDVGLIDSWMNMHTLLASRPNVDRRARRARSERALFAKRKKCARFYLGNDMFASKSNEVESRYLPEKVTSLQVESSV